MRRKGGGISPLQSPTEQGPKTDFFGDPLVSPRAEDTKNVKTMENYFPVSPKKKDTADEKKEATKAKPLAATQPVYKKITPVQTSKPKVMVSSTTKKVGLGAKKIGGGLGAKKLTAKVDDRLFDQAPGEDAPAIKPSSSNPASPRSGGVSPRDSSGHVALPPKSNRFAYSEDGFGETSSKKNSETTSNKNEDGPRYTMGGLESVPMNSRRGASGHVTLDRNAGKKTNIDTRNFGSNASTSASSRSAFGASPKYGNSGSGGGFGRNTSSSASTSTNPAAAGAANDHYYNATERFAGAKSISSDAFGSGGNRSSNNADDGFGWDANRYAGQSGFGSSDLRRGATSPRGDDLDLSASDLMEKISFQAKQDAAAFKNAASRGISGLKNMASSIFDELNR